MRLLPIVSKWWHQYHYSQCSFHLESINTIETSPFIPILLKNANRSQHTTKSTIRLVRPAKAIEHILFVYNGVYICSSYFYLERGLSRVWKGVGIPGSWQIHPTLFDSEFPPPPTHTHSPSSLSPPTPPPPPPPTHTPGGLCSLSCS